MSENFSFDCENWKINTTELTCAPTTQGAGRKIGGGGEQIVYSRNNYWRGDVTLNPLYREVMLDFQGWLAGLDGRHNTFDLCICDPFNLKLSDKSYEEQLRLIGYDITTLCGPVGGIYGLPHADGTCFADGTGYHIQTYTQARITDFAAEGSTSMQFNEAASYLKRGMTFSTPDNYFHRITKVEGNTVSFRPHLRRNVFPNTNIETENPKIRVRLSSDESGTPKVNYARWTDDIVLSVEEVMER